MFPAVQEFFREVLLANTSHLTFPFHLYLNYRWTNCNGNQRCGTCIVDVGPAGLDACNRQALDEELTLRENPLGYRLSCVTSIYGDVTVKVLPPVTASQGKL